MLGLFHIGTGERQFDPAADGLHYNGRGLVADPCMTFYAQHAA